MKTLLIKELDIDDIKPYWRNPRNNSGAVSKVSNSIDRYGYNNLITVDKDNIIVTGHTRHKALKQLGHAKVKVIVLDIDAQMAKEYRIIDNKTSEIAVWTDELIPELREIDDLDFIDEYFDVDINDLLDSSIGSIGYKEATQTDIEKKEEQLGSRYDDGRKAYDASVTQLMCPSCGHEFNVR